MSVTRAQNARHQAVAITPKHLITPQLADCDTRLAIAQTATERSIATHIEKHFPADRLAALKTQFDKNGSVQLDHILPEKIHRQYLWEIERAFKNSGEEHHLINNETRTLRKYKKLPYDIVMRESILAQRLYQSKSLQRLASSIVGDTVTELNDEFAKDRVVAHQLSKGLSHGTHVDPKLIALVLILKGLPKSAGGGMRFFNVPPRHRPVYPEKIKAITKKYRARAKTFYLPGNSAHISLAGELPHEVLPVTGPGTRVNVTHSYGTVTSDQSEQRKAYERYVYEKEVLSTDKRAPIA